MSMHVVPSQTRCEMMRDSSHRDHAQHLAALGDLDAEQPLGAERERDVVARRVEIVLAVGPRDDLIVLAVLADLLEAAVQVADVRNAAHDRLAVELEHEAQHAVRRRVLRPDVDEHVLALEIRLERRRRFDGDRRAAFVDDERHALRTSLRVEPGRGERDFDRALRRRHRLLSRLLAARRAAAACRAADPRTRRRSRALPSSSALPGCAASACRSCSERLRSGRAAESPCAADSLPCTAPTSGCGAGRDGRRTDAEHVVALALEPIGALVDGPHARHLERLRPSASSHLDAQEAAVRERPQVPHDFDRLLEVADTRPR